MNRQKDDKLKGKFFYNGTVKLQKTRKLSLTQTIKTKSTNLFSFEPPYNNI
jgi:hypothetical protein